MGTFDIPRARGHRNHQKHSLSTRGFSLQGGTLEGSFEDSWNWEGFFVHSNLPKTIRKV